MKLALAVAIAGCYRPAHVVGDAAEGDGVSGPDAPAGTCFGAGAFQVCVTSPSPGPLVLAGTIFTSMVSGNPVDPNCLASTEWSWVGPGQPDACVMFASDVQTGATTRVFGDRPLVVLATGSITIAANQLVDVASHHGAAFSGPGAATGRCAAFASTPKGNIVSGKGASGGGAGGSFAFGLGGSGGAGNVSLAGGGAATIVQIPNVLTAGCTGQTAPGGSGSPMIPSAPGGVGGGALYLASQTKIIIAGRIDASGAGGGVGGTDFQTGGGGGGSGGMIVIYAPAIAATGTIIANGGGGASGGSYETVPQLMQQAAQPGADPDPTMPTTAAAGGSGTLAGGGAGSVMGQVAQSGATGNNTAGQGDAGGGGGGGGGGLIIAPAGSLAAATVSPPAVAGP